MISQSESEPPKARTRRGSSNAQRLRKRETDRLAQRANRERTKNRIELLEQEVRRLKAQDQNAVVRELMETTETQQKKNEELEGALLRVLLVVRSACRSIRPSNGLSNLIGELTPCNEEATTGNEDVAYTINCDIPNLSHELPITLPLSLSGIIDPSNRRSGLISENLRETFYGPSSAHTECAIPLQNSLSDLYTHHGELAFSLDLSESTGQEHLGPDIMARGFPESLCAPFRLDGRCDTSDQDACLLDPYLSSLPLPIASDKEKWGVSNNAFLRTLEVGATLLEPDQVDPNVPCQAILRGWHTVDVRQREKPIWNMLRVIDERVFGSWTSKVQKIALMYVTHTLVKFRMDPTPENFDAVPTWLRSRPSQERVIHPPVIDLLLWPGLRDRLVFDHQEYTKSGEFSSFYCNHLRFYWPFSEDTVGTYNPHTKSFQVSEKFKEYAFDLRNWTMDCHFLTRYPELKDDITAYEDRMLCKT